MAEKCKNLDLYEVNYHTLAILPDLQKDGEVYSKIYEGANIYMCKLPPSKIIKRSCEYFGCTYEGKRKGTRVLMNYKHKLPISIDSKSTIYAFPTHSPLNHACMWFFLHHISDRVVEGEGKTTVIFRNDRRLSVDVSFHIFNNQILRTNLLQTKIRHNQEDSENPL